MQTGWNLSILRPGGRLLKFTVNRIRAKRRGITAFLGRLGHWPPLAALTLVLGCTPVPTRFDIDALGEAGAAKSYTQRFDRPGWFSTDMHGDYEFTFELPPELVDLPDRALNTEEEAASGTGEDEASKHVPEPLADQMLMSQIVHIRCVWRPRPGTTFAEPTQTNANVVYCLIRGMSAISYEGAGFVSFFQSRDGRTITGELESAALFPTRLIHDPADIFGPCHVRGTFTAIRNPAEVAALKQRVRRLLGPPTSNRPATGLADAR